MDWQWWCKPNAESLLFAEVQPIIAPILGAKLLIYIVFHTCAHEKLNVKNTPYCQCVKFCSRLVLKFLSFWPRIRLVLYNLLLLRIAKVVALSSCSSAVLSYLVGHQVTPRRQASYVLPSIKLRLAAHQVTFQCTQTYAFTQ